VFWGLLYNGKNFDSIYEEDWSKILRHFVVFRGLSRERSTGGASVSTFLVAFCGNFGHFQSVDI
jgi:hypothetical protein